MTQDLNKGIFDIKYNHLNLLVEINFDEHTVIPSILYKYDATGVKLAKIVKENGTTISTQYADGFVYNNAEDGTMKLQFFSHPEGYVEPVSEGQRVKGFDIGGPGVTYSSYKYVFQYKDHLGNVRLSYSDTDLNGSINPNTEIIEESNYYPFGLQQKGYNTNVSPSGNALAQNYKYNGKEHEEELGINSYDYGARSYMPDLGRWKSIDPHADSYFSITPYSSFANNPISFVDPTGEDILFWQWKKDTELTSGGTWEQVAYDQLDKETQKGIENFAKTESGKAFFSSFANKGDKLGSVEFEETGEYANHNLNFQEENTGNREGHTPDPINRNVFGPMQEGKTNSYIDFYFRADTKMTNISINMPETIGHELFGHLDQYLDDYVKAFEKSGSTGANTVYSNYLKNNSSGQDHFRLAGGDVKKYNTFISQLKSILNPQKVQNHVNAERAKILNVAKSEKANGN